MSARSVVLLGGGGHAAVVADAARSSGWTIDGYLDDDESLAHARTDEAIDFVRLGPLAELARITADRWIHAAVGDPALRRAWLDLAHGRRVASIVHPSAVVSPSARLDEGVFIGPGAIVNARARLGRGAIVNTGAIVEHDCIVGPFAHIAPGAVLAGRVTVGEAALVGASATVAPGVAIGARATLGAGAVATSPIEADVRAVGVPARAMAVMSKRNR